VIGSGRSEFRGQQFRGHHSYLLVAVCSPTESRGVSQSSRASRVQQRSRETILISVAEGIGRRVNRRTTGSRQTTLMQPVKARTLSQRRSAPADLKRVAELEAYESGQRSGAANVSKPNPVYRTRLYRQPQRLVTVTSSRGRAGPPSRPRRTTPTGHGPRAAGDRDTQ
jgi:hypothetical protein